MKISQVGTLRSTVAAAVVGAAVLYLAVPGMAADGPPIKIGILHSLSGTMAISEVSLPGTLISSRKIDSERSRIIDIAPTVLKYFGLQVPQDIDGKPLF